MNNYLKTLDFKDWSFREMEQAIKLLEAYIENPIECIDQNSLTVNLNNNSGYVFLSDEDYNTAMMNGDKLEQWFSCPECGHEGFKGEMRHGLDNKECLDFLNGIEAISEDEYNKYAVAMEL